MKLRRMGFRARVCCALLLALQAIGCATEENQEPERLKAGALFDSDVVYQQSATISSTIYCSENLGDDFWHSSPDCSPRADGTVPWLNLLYFRQNSSAAVIENVRKIKPNETVPAWITFELGTSYQSVGYRPYTVDLPIYGSHLSADMTGVEVRLPAAYACGVVFGGLGIDTVSFHAISLPNPGKSPTVIPLPRTWVSCYVN